MILYRWRGAFTNFGDELNMLLWPALLPGFFDNDPGVRFLGIGSVLDSRHPAAPLKLVAGSGYGGYEAKPRLHERFVIHWVRGPRTARCLGLPRELGLGDPAALVPQALGLRRSHGHAIGFMPHFESAAAGDWASVAALAGIRLIDPRQPPATVLHAVAGCRLLMSEALHGVIIADALRIPWIAIRPRVPVHRAKWRDWADTLGLSFHAHSLPASTPAEFRLETWSRIWSWRRARADPDGGVMRAAEALRHISRQAPSLSADAALHDGCARMLEAIERLKRHPLRGAVPAWQSRTRLQHGDESAYQPEPVN